MSTYTYNYLKKNFKSDIQFDVCNVLGRAASSLLSRGITISLGENACTDCKNTIWLPQALRTKLSSEEIDLVRYLMAHEQAHINHTNPDCLSSWDKHEHTYKYIQTCKQILQLLEDIRIEAKSVSQYVGSSTTISIGRTISLDKWDKLFDHNNAEMCLTHLIFVGHCDKDARKDGESEHWLNEQTSKLTLDAPRTLINYHSALMDFYDEIDDIPNQPLLTTEDMSALASRIADKIVDVCADDAVDQSIEDDLQEEINLSDLDYADKENLLPETGKEIPSLNHDKSQGIQTQVSADYSACGLVEQIAHGCLTTADKDEQITEKSIKPGGRKISFGHTRTTPDMINKEEAEKNYQHGLFSAGLFSNLVNRLRGTSRKGFGKPQISGMRVAARNIPAFIKGETLNILRRSKKQPHIGTAVVFLVDDSGSMLGVRQRVAWRGAAMLSIALERAKIPCCIFRFSSSYSVVKLFQQTTASIRKSFSLSYGNGTNIREPLHNATEILKLRKEDRKYIFILTDGETHNVQSYVHAANKAGIQVVPILFGEDAAPSAKNGGVWGHMDCVVIPDPNVSIGPILVEKLASYV